MTLTAAQRERIQYLIEYMNKGSSGKFLDAFTVEQLALIFATTPPYSCGCPGTFQEGLRDSPFATLLTVLLAVAA